MSLFQFPEMHTLSYRFICSVELLFWENHLVLPFGPIWVRNSPKILIFFICINLSVTSNRLTSRMKVLQKLYLQQDQEFFFEIMISCRIFVSKHAICSYIFLSFFFGFRRPNSITGLSGWRAPIRGRICPQGPGDSNFWLYILYLEKDI